MPRGFCGATGELDKVKLVLVCAEPGDPHPHESHDKTSVVDIFDSAYKYAYSCFENSKDVFHRNVRRILDLCFPASKFEEQIRLT